VEPRRLLGHSGHPDAGNYASAVCVGEPAADSVRGRAPRAWSAGVAVDFEASIDLPQL
jgi:hypothetical protein